MTFVLPLLILAIVLDLCFSNLLSKSNDYPGEIEVWNDIYDSDAECDVAIYGSSRAWVQINPQIIGDSLNLKAYNFGMDGHNFWLQYLRHKELIANNKKPQLIILSVDVFSLQKREDLYKQNQFLPYMLWNENMTEYTSSYIGYTKADYYVPFYRYGGRYNDLKTSLKILIENEPKESYRKDGYLGLDRKWNGDFEAAQADANSYEVIFDQESVQLMETFIQECDSLDIDLVMLYTPEHVMGQEYISNRSEVIDIYKNFSEKYDLDFYDYSNDKICLDTNQFYNTIHLNMHGADRFSKEFASVLHDRSRQ